MRRVALALCSVLLAAVGLPAGRAPEPVDASHAPPARLPIAFERNIGQADDAVDYLVRLPGASVAIAGAQAWFSAGGRPVRMQLAGARHGASADGRARIPGVVNDLRGPSSRWVRGIPLFERVRVEAVYPGVDLVYHGRDGRLEYDFVVAPDGDPDRIRLELTGADEATIGPDGELVLTTGPSTLTFEVPTVYQDIAGRRRAVDGAYGLEPAGDSFEATFRLGDYDPRYELVIDPVLGYGTLFGGVGDEDARGVAVGPDGDIYLGGATDSVDLHFADAQSDGADETVTGRDAFVARFEADGSSLVFATYIGGDGSEKPHGMALGPDGVYVTGTSPSTGLDFATPGAHQTANGGGNDAFLAKVSLDGSTLEFATYLGGPGTDESYDVTVDPQGRPWITGQSPGFDATHDNFPSPPGGSGGQYVARFSATGAREYAEFFGSTGCCADNTQIAVNASGEAYVTGRSADALQGFPGDDGTVEGGKPFMSRISSDGSSILSRGLTGSDIAVAPDGGVVVAGHPVLKRKPDLTADWERDIGAGSSDVAIARDGSIHLFGKSTSTLTKVDAFSTGFLFVAKLAPDGVVIYAGDIGGDLSSNALSGAVASDACGNTVVAGMANAGTTTLPLTPDALWPAVTGSDDAFFARVAPAPVAYVPSFDGDHVSEVDTSGAPAGATTVRQTAVTPFLFGAAAHPDGRRAFFTDFDKEAVVVFDRLDKTTKTIELPGFGVFPPIDGADPLGIAISPDGSRAYVANSGMKSMSVIDAVAETFLTSIDLPAASDDPGPFGVAVDPSGETVYVTDFKGDKVSVVDVATEAVSEIDVFGPARGVAVAPDGDTLYVARTSEFASFQLAVLDLTADPPQLTQVPLPAAPFGVAVHPTADEVYVTAVGRVFSVDADTLAVTEFPVSSLPAGSDLRPGGVSVTPDGQHVYVTSDDDRVYVWKAIGTHDYVERVDVGDGPTALGNFIGPREDGDGIPALLDADPSVCSSDFSDANVGGVSFGEVVDRGGLTAAVSDAPDPDGMLLEAIGTGTDPVRYSACGMSEAEVFAGGAAKLISCGSITASVQRDPVEFTFLNGVVRARTPAGSRIHADEISEDVLVLENTGTVAFEVVVRGEVDVLGPGESFAVASEAADTFITSGPDDFVAEGSATFEFSSDAQVVGFECSLDGAPYDGCSSPHDVGMLDDGHHHFAVRALDAAGTPDSSPAAWTWVVDRTPPAVAFTSPQTGLWVFGTLVLPGGLLPLVVGDVPVEVRVQDPHSGVAAFVLSVDGVPVPSGEVTYDASTQTHRFTYTSSGPGRHMIVARATNGSGLDAQAAIDIVSA